MNPRRRRIRPGEIKRTAKPPLHDLHKWAACATGHGPTEQAAIDDAFSELQNFLIQHHVDIHDRVWIHSSEETWDVNNKYAGYVVILKTRVAQHHGKRPRITV